MSNRSSWNTLFNAHREAAIHPVAGEVPPHEPKVAILACSDARVPPSVLFDQPAGNLFVIRIAGNTPVPAALASLDYAVEKLGIDLIIVLGHTNCGAVSAAAEGSCGGHLEPIVASICAIAAANPTLDPDEVAVLNVAAAVAALREHDGPTGTAARANTIDIRGAIHDLSTGRLRPVTPTDPPTPKTLTLTP